jgi:hypothetical protein
MWDRDIEEFDPEIHDQTDRDRDVSGQRGCALPIEADRHRGNQRGREGPPTEGPEQRDEARIHVVGVQRECGCENSDRDGRNARPVELTLQ